MYKTIMIHRLLTSANETCSIISRLNSEIDFLERNIVQNWFPCTLVNTMIGKLSDVLQVPNSSAFIAEKIHLFCSTLFISVRTNSLIKNSVN